MQINEIAIKPTLFITPVSINIDAKLNFNSLNAKVAIIKKPVNWFAL